MTEMSDEGMFSLLKWTFRICEKIALYASLEWKQRPQKEKKKYE